MHSFYIASVYNVLMNFTAKCTSVISAADITMANLTDIKQATKEAP